MKIIKSFEKWAHEDIEDLFGIKFQKQAPFLIEWLSPSGNVPSELQNLLDELTDDLAENVLGWNEAELLNRFIMPLLRSVRFFNREKRIQEFAARRLILPDPRYEITGFVDWMVARGRHEPQAPYFFIHEYKRFNVSENDPRGQLLIAMLAAQKYNADGRPIYGAWIVGGDWKFILLNEDVYSESYVYDATNPEAITKIWLILNKTKQIIYDRVDKLIAIEKAEKQNK